MRNLKCLGKSWFTFSFKTQFFCRLRDLQNLFLLDPRLLNATIYHFSANYIVITGRSVPVVDTDKIFLKDLVLAFNNGSPYYTYYTIYHNILYIWKQFFFAKKRRRIYTWMLNVSFNHTVVILHEWKDSDICRVLSFDCSRRAQVIHAKTTVHVSRITKRIHTVVVAPLAIGVVIVAKVSTHKNSNSNNYKFFLKFS